VATLPLYARYAHPRLLAVFFLGIASGLPLALVSGTLSIRLTESGVDKATIGLFAYASYPYVFKFVWSPLMDHVRLPFLSRRFGQRRSWMLLSQAGLIVAIGMLGASDPIQSPGATAMFALLVAFFSASQDIVIDAFRVEYLTKEQYTDGAAMGVLGYRVGMLISGAGALMLAEILPWSLVYSAMSGAILIGVVTIVCAGEPVVARRAIVYRGVGDWVSQAVKAPFAQFIASHPRWPLLLLYAGTYAMSDGFIGFMSGAFLRETGFSKTEIAAVVKIYGFAATILGAFAAGMLVRRTGLWKALMLAGVVQIIANLGYLLVTVTGAKLWALMLAVSLDNFSGGMMTAVGVAYLMRLCHTDYTATQYALLSSLAALARTTTAGAAGYISAEYGWAAMFGTSAILGIPALAFLLALRHDDVMQNLVENREENTET